MVVDNAAPDGFWLPERAGGSVHSIVENVDRVVPGSAESDGNPG
jgi:hypothetical protein